MSGAGSIEVQVVRDRLDAGLEQELLSFWERRAGFGGDEAGRRLDDVVCVLRRDGRLAGVSSVSSAEVELVGGRRFWIFRTLLDEGLEEQQRALIGATFHALDADRDGTPEAPEGLCVLLDEEQRRRWPEAEWPDPRMIFAGYQSDGRQVRIAYFTDQIHTDPEPEGGWRAPPGYEFALFKGQTRISAEDVISVWATEGGLPRQEAERRVAEVLFVGIDARGQLAAISTAYLARNNQLLADFWHVRVLVREAHRKSNISIGLSATIRGYLEQRFVGGEDRRGLGFIFEIENEGLKRYFPKGVWNEWDVRFIGENARGAHVRVHYFPGVHTPEPVLAPESDLVHIPR
jgi:hypothetical protein